ncbi:MAG: S8 family serine peptidase [Candidatus Bathyarchaeota archaeon]|nr:MAG: S8 family serine peptidase [Candidatus Bathyarchaeota archaeon]
MRRKRIAYITFSVFLILILAFPPISSFPFTSKAHNPEGENTPHAGLTEFAPPIIHNRHRMDKDADGIQDSLETLISQQVTNRSAVLPVVVTLQHPVSDQDLDWFKMLGGYVTHVYKYVTYGFAGVIPAANIPEFVALEKGKLSVVEHDAPIQYHLDVGVPIIRARPTVWDTLGYTGSSNHSIAIVDTGIDDSHPDLGPFEDLNFSSKIVGWYDATSDSSTTPEDYGEHGSHVAGIAAGTGAANLLQGSDRIETTFTYVLPPDPPGPSVYGYVDYIDVENSGVIDLNCSWGGTNNVLMVLSSPTGEVERRTGTSQPLTISYNTTGTANPTGRYEIFVGNIAGPSGTPFSCLETYPYQGQNDGHNLFTGVAPDSKLVGVKVFDNTGSGTASLIIAGMDWIIENRIEYHIVAASMSVGLVNGATYTTLDEKADTMVANGIITVVSAGNDYPEFTIGSPGTAAYVLTVAATNDLDGIASYSSNGDTAKNEYGLIKPDVAAPGGTFDPQFGNKILSVDSNEVDAGHTSYVDQQLNDYQQMAGTSMSTPHVSGLAALIAQALGEWNWTQEEALKVKMLIGMTAFETQSGESSNEPPLNRGSKDSKEGYGRVSADAAIEATSMTHTIGELGNATFGPNPTDKKVWARQVSLMAKNEYRFNLSVPFGADYDLYLYNGTSDNYGQPIIVEKSVNASTGTDETILFTPMESDLYYIVVKWVGGNGSFNLQSTGRLLRDVAITSVEPSTNETYASWPVNISVAVRNNGGATETFNVTAYYNASTLGTQTITNLTPDGTMNMTFSWNTTNVAPCFNYTIIAEASEVPSETDIINNNFTDGYVEVKMLADINGDGIVDIHDFTVGGKAYGSVEGDPRYDPQTDLTRDGYIDIRDMMIIGRNYGKTC